APLAPPAALPPHRAAAAFRRMEALARFTERFGSMVSRAFLTVLYFAVLGPFALVYQLFADPLRLRRPKAGNWQPWVADNETLSAARRQD
ncbi:MAG TPA: hypothetical protein VJP77_07675, partial [Planctomycetota bacterium]|nr:hypothetical protein [Planctomycetota bacterium]